MSRSYLKKFSQLLVCVAILLPIAALTAYFVQFGGHGFSVEQSRWAEFGGFFGAIVTLSATLASSAIAIFATILLPEQLRDEAAGARARDQVQEFSRRFYDRDFYLNIMVPAWEVATKWLYWKEGEAGKANQYRLEVIGGRYFNDDYDEFSNPEEGSEAAFQNTIHARMHFDPIDFGPNGPLPNEHMLLTMWWSFWGDLALAIKSKSITTDDAKRRFSREYSYWLNFHQQVWMLGCLMTSNGVNKLIEHPRDFHDANLAELHQILPYLEGVLFEKPDMEKFEKNRKVALSLYDALQPNLPDKYKALQT